MGTKKMTYSGSFVGNGTFEIDSICPECGCGNTHSINVNDFDVPQLVACINHCGKWYVIRVKLSATVTGHSISDIND